MLTFKHLHIVKNVGRGEIDGFLQHNVHLVEWQSSIIMLQTAAPVHAKQQILEKPFEDHTLAWRRLLNITTRYALCWPVYLMLRV